MTRNHENVSELPTPPEINRTVQTLAPKGAPLEQRIAAMSLAVDLHKAKKAQTKPNTVIPKS